MGSAHLEMFYMIYIYKKVMFHSQVATGYRFCGVVSGKLPVTGNFAVGNKLKLHSMRMGFNQQKSNSIRKNTRVCPNIGYTAIYGNLNETDDKPSNLQVYTFPSCKSI